MEIHWFLTLAGLSVSIMSALESRVTWIASFCALFGEGCRRTEDYTMLRTPLSWWGIGYYAVLAILVYLASPWQFWWIMAGFGFELALLWIMASMRVFCIFCLLNAMVVGGLAWIFFDPAKIWQIAACALFFFTGANYLISRENPSKMSPAQPQAPAAVAAKINGDTITREDLERPLSQQIYKLESKIYKLKRRRLEDMIENALLTKEAKHREVSTEELLDAVLDKDQDASDEQKKEIIGKYVTGLKEKYEVEIFLQKPPLPLTQVEIEDSPARGPADAAVIVVEFSDPLCPACRAAHETTRRIKREYGDRIRWVYKDFPLKRHKGARKAAEAAHCAGEQGKFWEYQDRLRDAKEEQPDADVLKTYAKSLGLDKNQFDACLHSGRYRSRIENDIQTAKNAGISAIPTYIINGKMISGARSFDEFKQNIESELQNAAGVSAKN